MLIPLIVATYPVGLFPWGVTTGLINADVYPDLVTTNVNDMTVSVLLGQADGTFTPGRSFPAGGTPWEVTAGSFSRTNPQDTFSDLIVSNYEFGTISHLVGGPNGSLGPPLPIRVPDGPWDLSSLRIDSDECDDLVVLTYTALVSFLGCPLRPVHVAQVDLGSSRFTLTDINRDGQVDVVVTNGLNATLTVLLGDGRGRFVFQTRLYVPTSPFGIASADFNHDGYVDLVVTHLGGTDSFRPISVLLGYKEGFLPPSLYPAGQTPWDITVLDRIGNHDVVVSNPFGGTVSLLRGRGDGTFRLPLPLLMESYPIGVVSFPCASYKGVKHRGACLVVANAGANTVSVLYE